MMLRVLVVLLLLANALLWAGSHDALRALGLAPAPPPPTPDPLARQVRPEALTVRSLDDVVAQVAGHGDDAAGASAPTAPERPPDEALRASAASPDGDAPGAVGAPVPVLTLPLPTAPEPDAAPDEAAPESAPTATEPATDTSDAELPAVGPAVGPAPEAAKLAAAQPVCWQAGPFDALQAQRLREAAASLPPGSWQLRQTSGQTPRWMVYLGGMDDELAVLARRSELHAQGLDVDRAGPGFELGLSLGRYSSRAAADRALQMLSAEAGVSGARVVQERTEEATYFLRAESAVSDWRERLQALPLAGRSLRRCS